MNKDYEDNLLGTNLSFNTWSLPAVTSKRLCPMTFFLISPEINARGCLGNECAWWHTDADRCDPTGLMDDAGDLQLLIESIHNILGEEI